MMKKSKPLDYKLVIAEYPLNYDAHHDQLSECWDHKESVNLLLAALRQADNIIELMKQPKIRPKNQHRRDPT